jgi:hypothetical protein
MSLSSAGRLNSHNGRSGQDKEEVLMGTTMQSGRMRDMEGHRVSLTLADGSTFNDVILVSAGRGGVSSLWLDVEGMDVFVNHALVLDTWEPGWRKAA